MESTDYNMLVSKLLMLQKSRMTLDMVLVETHHLSHLPS